MGNPESSDNSEPTSDESVDTLVSTESSITKPTSVNHAFDDSDESLPRLYLHEQITEKALRIFPILAIVLEITAEL